MCSLPKATRQFVTLLLASVLVMVSSGCCSKAGLIASSMSDLASPVQEKRDAAAEILRASYRPESREYWESVVRAIKIGMSKTDVLSLHIPFKDTLREPVQGMWPDHGRPYEETYRLDDAWVLSCWYRNDGDLLYELKLNESMSYVWVPPPESFTGVWITYYVNGQKSHEIHYENGHYSGEFIAYHTNGSKSYVQHYRNHRAEGEDTGYYASGRIMYRGTYKADAPVGTWIWYNEDGSISSTREFSKL